MHSEGGETQPDYRARNVAVLGLGGSGDAAARLLAREGARVTALDSAEGPALCATAERLRPLGIDTVLGPAAEQCRSPFDLAVISPGIDPRAPIVRRFIDRGVEIIAEIELAHSLTPWPIVAITGTNGKTTSVDLTTAMLRGCGWRVTAAGNVGLPFSEVPLRAEPLDAVVLEVSSFQLERIRRFRPVVAAWLNFAPDHLDRYPDLDAYRAAKLRIFENQKNEDRAVVNFVGAPGGLRARRITFSAHRDGADLALRGATIVFEGRPLLGTGGMRLRGAHNVENAMAALGIGIALGLDPAALGAPLSACPSRPHRLEPVGEIGGVLYINDSKSTNPDSLEKALLAMDRPVVLVAGGKDKGFAFDDLGELVAERARGAVLIGEIRGRLLDAWGARLPCRAVDSLVEAVEEAARRARPGDAVLLSPGTSSYDMFCNYEDRGEQFRRLVNQMGG